MCVYYIYIYMSICALGKNKNIICASIMPVCVCSYGWVYVSLHTTIYLI